jgi:hypothetical protein
MNRSEMQFKTRSKIKATREGKALTFGFRFGPIHVFVIANLPEANGNEEGPLVYVKVDLRMNEDWQEHSVESPGPVRR